VNTLELIAAAVAERVIVAGSLPPGGRDLDLVARSSAIPPLAEAFEVAGFDQHGSTWARFRRCVADVVDVAPSAAWRLPPSELESLFAEAEPIEPQGHVCRPTPHHALLILARRTMREGRRLKDKRRDRIRAELERDRAGFAVAGARADAWGAGRALELLERAYRDGTELSFGARRRAIRAELGASRSSAAAAISSWRAVLDRPRRGTVVMILAEDTELSDYHAARLAAILNTLGYAASLARPTRHESDWAQQRVLARGGIVVQAGGRSESRRRPRLHRRLAFALTPGAGPGPGSGVPVLDANCPAHELCAELARLTWDAL